MLYNSNNEFKRLSQTAKRVGVLLVIGLMQTTFAVEYDGEKSFLIEIPYKVCTIAPLPEGAAKQGIVVITTEKAKELYDKEALFFDARSKTHYTKSHIKGAQPVVFDASKAEHTIISLPQNKARELVFYCYGETCANSYEAALAAREYGYKNVYWYSAGFDGWVKKKYPTEGK